MAGQSINVNVDIGFENIVGIDSFYEGEGLVNFYSGDIIVANTINWTRIIGIFL